MQTKLKLQLCGFMFLQYFVWGAWYMSMASYLSTTLEFGGYQVGLAYGAFAIGAMIAPFFVGLIADRYFASEKMLALLAIAGGGLMLWLAQLKTFEEFYPALILYCATYVPTLALGNSLSMQHLANPKADFPLVKTMSAVGWIAGGSTLSLAFEDGETKSVQFILAGVASFVLGVYSYFLPHTPPKKTGANVSISEILGLDALVLLKQRSFAVCIFCMFLICFPIYFYFVNMSPYLGELGWKYPNVKMSLAQVSDVVFLVSLPFFLSRLGYKWTLAIGILAWIARYFLLAASTNPTEAATAMIYTAILLHGVCYDFLFIAGQLYVDDNANERNRAAAQGFIAFVLWGVGNFVGTQLAGFVQERYTIPDTKLHDWYGIWIVPAVGSLVVLVIFVTFFREPRRGEPVNA